MKETVLKVIQDLTNQKIELKQEPLLILDQELQKSIKKEVLDVLRELWKEKKIDLGKTINNNYVKLRDENSPPRRRKTELHKQNLE